VGQREHAQYRGLYFLYVKENENHQLGAGFLFTPHNYKARPSESGTDKFMQRFI
jgi:hypothetical protein